MNIHFAPPRDCGGIFLFPNSFPTVILRHSATSLGCIGPALRHGSSRRAVPPSIVTHRATSPARVFGTVPQTAVAEAPAGTSHFRLQMSLNYLLRGQRGTRQTCPLKLIQRAELRVCHISTCFPPYTAGHQGWLAAPISLPPVGWDHELRRELHGGGTLDSKLQPLQGYTPENALLYSELAGAVTCSTFPGHCGLIAFLVVNVAKAASTTVITDGLLYWHRNSTDSSIRKEQQLN